MVAVRLLDDIGRGQPGRALERASPVRTRAAPAAIIGWLQFGRCAASAAKGGASATDRGVQDRRDENLRRALANRGRPPSHGWPRPMPSSSPVSRSGRAGRQRPSERAAACPLRKSGEAIRRADSGPCDPWRSDEPRWCIPRRGRPRHQLVVGAGAPAAQREGAGVGPVGIGKAGEHERRPTSRGARRPQPAGTTAAHGAAGRDGATHR